MRHVEMSSLKMIFRKKYVLKYVAEECYQYPLQPLTTNLFSKLFFKNIMKMLRHWKYVTVRNWIWNFSFLFIYQDQINFSTFFPKLYLSYTLCRLNFEKLYPVILIRLLFTVFDNWPQEKYFVQVDKFPILLFLETLESNLQLGTYSPLSFWNES